MKIQCNVCESAEAVVLCCADDAALCYNCDEKVHAANKLASKHQRVSLSHSTSHIPKCDICQETAGYFFCLEDRALLCRKCDVVIHSVNSLVSSHQRFLLTGVKVGLEAADPGASSSMGKSSSGDNKIPGAEILQSYKLPYSGGSSADSMQQWQFDDFLALTVTNVQPRRMKYRVQN